MAAFPGIDDANVYGVRLPNHDGRVGCAAIILQQGSKLDTRSLVAHLKAILPMYAIPHFVRIMDVMKLTENMKHQKHEMREQGVDHDKIPGETILWLRDGDYVKFTKEDWEGLKKGHHKM